MDLETINLLKSIKNQGFSFDHVDKYEVVQVMLSHIGHPDSQIRDDLIYECLAHLFHDRHFTEEELTNYLHILLGNNHLTYDMDNNVENSVLTRSFTILQLVILIHVHNRDKIINRDDINKAFITFLSYFNQEKMLKGYDVDLGWIHAIAHSADLMNQFMQVSWFKEKELKKMFEAIAKKMRQEKHLFVFNEEERMVLAVKSGIKRGILSNEYLINWISEFSAVDQLDSLPEKIYLTNNIKHFLRALYFAFIHEAEYVYLTNLIKDILVD